MLKYSIITLKWQTSYRKYFEPIGYTFTGWGKEFDIKTKDLPKHSGVRIDIICDKCGKTYETSYINYLKYNEIYGKDLCKQCKFDVLNNDEHGTLPYCYQDFFRLKTKKWYFDSLNINNNQCAITGKTSNVIHHPYSFRKIIFETFESLNIDVRKDISMYSESEKKLLSEKCLEIHYKYGYGICFSKEIHKDYHKKYGWLNNTYEQLSGYIRLIINLDAATGLIQRLRVEKGEQK